MRSRLFTQQVVIAALFAAIAGVAYYDSSGLRGDGDFNRTLQMCKRASKVEVFEGLPHQMFEPELLAQEQQRSDVFQNHDFDFYEPAFSLPGDEFDGFISKVVSRRTYRAWQGFKACGGFHPDFLLRFHSADGIIDIQICLGCGEALLFGRDGYSYVEISEFARERWKTLQEKSRTKRPLPRRSSDDEVSE
ncbi:MAG: hypothetical protein KF777_07665 [Planctomycetaceae bacterium]|nr:hypothetical protein [Planctomycetaceae bacterium]